MAVPFSNTKLRVPKGFQNILECLAREVLRSQPDNIHEFAAAYFETLLKRREETGHDPAVHGASLEDRNYNNEAYKKKQADKQEVQQKVIAATTIQAQFRQKTSKEETQVLREEDAAIKIQSGFRGHIDRQRVRKIREGHNDEHEENDHEFDLSAPEIEQAAIKIQAGFKGYKARQELAAQNQTEEASVKDAVPDTEGEDKPEVHIAAAKIQAGFRGYKTRKELKDESPTNEQPASKTPTNEQQASSETPTNEQQPASQDNEGIEDIDLTDPDLSKAALKVQAGFRGLKSRKELQKKKELQKQAEPVAPPQSDEIVDIDLTDPDVEKAAVKIQAGFKGLKARKDLLKKTEVKDEEEAEHSPYPAAGSGIDQSEAEKAAVKIQAVYRGYTTRKSLKPAIDNRTPEPADTKDNDVLTDASNDQAANNNEEIDIDLTDPEVEKATLKLQAGFKGLKARKKMLEEAEALKAHEASSEKDDDQNEEPRLGSHDPDKTPSDPFVEVSKEMIERHLSKQEDVDNHSGLDREKAAAKIQAGFRGMKTRKEMKAILGSRKEDEEKNQDTEDGEEEADHIFEDEPDEM